MALILNVCRSSFAVLSVGRYSATQDGGDPYGWTCAACSCMNVTFMAEFHKKEQDLNENINKDKLQGSSPQHFLTQEPPNLYEDNP